MKVNKIRQKVDKMKDIIQEIEEIQLQWFGYIMRREDSAQNKDVFNLIPQKMEVGKSKTDMEEWDTD